MNIKFLIYSEEEFHADDCGAECSLTKLGGCCDYGDELGLGE